MDNQSTSRQNKIIRFAQTSIIIIVVCVALVNLTLQWGNSNMWTAILTAIISHVIPDLKWNSINVTSNAVKKIISNQ